MIVHTTMGRPRTASNGYRIDLLVRAARAGRVHPDVNGIARSAGVSVQSVRNVLLGARVSPELRARVLAALDAEGDA